MCSRCFEELELGHTLCHQAFHFFLCLRENKEANSEAEMTPVLRLPTIRVALVQGAGGWFRSTCFSPRRQQECGRQAGSSAGVEPARVL